MWECQFGQRPSKRLRREAGRELANRTGLSLSTIYNLAGGHFRPSAKAIAAIMAAFPDLPFERLFVTDSMPPDSREVAKKSSSQEIAA
jgi:transcriptional regulator with XRE-family HTH domain